MYVWKRQTMYEWKCRTRIFDFKTGISYLKTGIFDMRTWIFDMRTTWIFDLKTVIFLTWQFPTWKQKFLIWEREFFNMSFWHGNANFDLKFWPEKLNSYMIFRTKTRIVFHSFSDLIHNIWRFSFIHTRKLELFLHENVNCLYEYVHVH